MCMRLRSTGSTALQLPQLAAGRTPPAPVRRTAWRMYARAGASPWRRTLQWRTRARHPRSQVCRVGAREAGQLCCSLSARMPLVGEVCACRRLLSGMLCVVALQSQSLSCQCEGLHSVRTEYALCTSASYILPAFGSEQTSSQTMTRYGEQHSCQRRVKPSHVNHLLGASVRAALSPLACRPPRRTGQWPAQRIRAVAPPATLT